MGQLMHRSFVILAVGMMFSAHTHAQTNAPVRVGVATILSGDLAVLGQNIVRTVETYRKYYLRHPIEFITEDAKKGSADGLRAYQRLINLEHVHMLIGGTSSNGTIAGKDLINRSKTVMITPVTGGSNIDSAGPYIFRIGNSDVLNGIQQADYFIDNKLFRVAMLTEETEYTLDIAKFFRKRFSERGGQLVFDETFLPDTTDFRTQITLLKRSNPQAMFVGTQTGLAFGLFLRQLYSLSPDLKFKLHTNFLAASNPDAFAAAGDAIYGVNYMAPSYDDTNPALKQFFERYKEDHGAEPDIAFHTAGTVDALNMLQDYLDSHPQFDRQGFRDYLLAHIKSYRGLMGVYSFDGEGNANIGFRMAQVTRDRAGR